jgi:hypothetical protein
MSRGSRSIPGTVLATADTGTGVGVISMNPPAELTSEVPSLYVSANAEGTYISVWNPYRRRWDSFNLTHGFRASISPGKLKWGAFTLNDDDEAPTRVVDPAECWHECLAKHNNAGAHVFKYPKHIGWHNHLIQWHGYMTGGVPRCSDSCNGLMYDDDGELWPSGDDGD